MVEDESSFAVYYCSFCGAFALVIDVKLDTLPTRKTDGAHVLDTKARFRFAFVCLFYCVLSFVNGVLAC